MITKLFPQALLFLILLSSFVGCLSSAKYNEFTKSINFSGLADYNIKEVQITGNDVKAANAEELETLSQIVLESELSERGFNRVSAKSDFYWVVIWDKSASFSPNVTDSINGPRVELNRADDPGGNFAVRWHLTLQAYNAADDALFWEKKLPNLFEAIELAEWRIQASVERGIKNFPLRVEVDPNLPSIE